MIHLGAIEDALASPCSQHTAILRYLQAHSDNNVRRRGVVYLTYEFLGVHVRGFEAEGSVSFGAQLLLASYLGISPLRKMNRLLDNEWVNLPIISHWMNWCSEYDGEKCQNPMKIMRVVPDLLVDVKRKCIVEGRESSQYMALSYRLGKATPFRLFLRDLDTFRKDGVLEDEQVSGKLPPTVRHAIRLAEKLGFAYLWTDVLCIIHDGPATFADQLNKMSAIYDSATATIVATDGDGADGISGLYGISGPRDVQQPAFAIRDHHVIVSEPEGHIKVTTDIDYNKRGWTYQEYIMSPRRLLFVNQQAHWLCQCRQTRESDRGSSPVRDSSTLFEFIRWGYPDLTQLSELLSWYNKRDLTYPGDALPAISGLLAVLSRRFEGGFLYGLPERFFDIGLGWRPYPYHTRYSGDSMIEQRCRRRRRPTLDGESYSIAPAASEMPSWSWTAWQGGISIGLNEVAQVVNNPYRVFCETSPITEWFTGGEPSSSDRRRIKYDWHIDRSNVDNQDQVLSESWTQMEAVKFDRLGSRGMPPESIFWRPIIYQRQGVKTREPTFWYYPFRMPEMNDSIPFEIPEQTRYLFCKTWKASVLLCDRRDRDKTRESSLDMELWANDPELRVGRSRIGRIWLHNAEQFEEETDAVTNADGRTASIDVVAISRSSSSGRIHGQEVFGEPWPLKDRINVLWVKWEQGIAYRVASGFVNEEDWVCLELEEVGLVLG